jgi:hypothetical protein
MNFVIDVNSALQVIKAVAPIQQTPDLCFNRPDIAIVLNLLKAILEIAGCVLESTQLTLKLTCCWVASSAISLLQESLIVLLDFLAQALNSVDG